MSDEIKLTQFYPKKIIESSHRDLANKSMKSNKIFINTAIKIL